MRIPRHLDHRRSNSFGDTGNLSASAIWKYHIDENHIHVRSSQERERLAHGVCGTYTVVQLKHGGQDFHDERIIFDD